RLHNMRTLDPLPPEKRKRIALETRELYAPLAHRFGMAGVKAELEDLSFKYLEPEDYKQLARQVKARRVERDRTIERMRAPLSDELRRAGIAGWEIVGRPKNLWSIVKKMKKRGKPFEEIYDLLAVRVLVNNITDCYHVLGIIHHTWTPLQERIKDYIASPKSNGYAVEVLAAPQARPARDWLAHVQTGRARQKIRQWIKQEEQERSVTLGREILGREIRRRRLDPPTPEQLAQAAQKLGLGAAEQGETAIGSGDVQIGQMINALYPDIPADEQHSPKPTACGR